MQLLVTAVSLYGMVQGPLPALSPIKLAAEEHVPECGAVHTVPFLDQLTGQLPIWS